MKRIEIAIFSFAILSCANLPAEPVPLPEPEILTLSSTVDLPFYVDEKIELERRQVREIPVEGLQKVMIVDPTIAEARPLTDSNHVYLQALSFGDTYLLIWTSQGRRTIQVKVLSSLRKKEESKAKKEGGYKTTMGFTSNVQNSRAYNSGQEYKSQRNYYSFTGQGKTALGKNVTDLRVEQIQNKNQLSYFRTQVQNRAGNVQAGDLNSDLTQLTLPLTAFQGAQWSSPQPKMVTLDLLGGYSNKQLWDKQFASGSNEPENPFVGFKTAFKPGKNLELLEPIRFLLNLVRDPFIRGFFEMSP